MLRRGCSNTLPCFAYTESHSRDFFSGVNSESHPWPESGISSLFICSLAGISCHACDWLLRHRRATPCWGKGHPPDLDAGFTPTLAFPFSHRLLRGAIHFRSHSAAFMIFRYFTWYLSAITPRACADLLVVHSSPIVLLHTPLDNRDQ